MVTASVPAQGRSPASPRGQAARIRIQGVSHTYAGRGASVKALADIHLTVEPGQFLSIIGPSGCGKSTLLRIVAGLVRPSEGEVVFETGSGPVRELPGGDIGFVFQDSVLLPWKTVWDNVIFPLQVLGRADQQAEAAIRELLELAGLRGFERALPKELSGGMRQRVSIVRALAMEPRILLMDEPFGALDALTRDRLNIELLRMWDQRPKTIMFVTHSIEEAVFLSDRVVVMSQRPGRILEDLAIELDRPRAIEVRDEPVFRKYVAHLRGLLG